MENLFRRHLSKLGDLIPDRIAAADQDESITFGALFAEAERAARILDRERCGPVARIQAAGGRWCQFLLAYAAVVYSGRVPVIGEVDDGELKEITTLVVDSQEKQHFAFSVLNREAPSINLRRYFDNPLDIVCSSGSTGSKRPYLFSHEHWVDEQRMKYPRLPLNVAHFGVAFSTSTGVHGVALRHLLGGLSSFSIAPMNCWNDVIQILDERRVFELSTTPFALMRLLDTVGPNSEAPSTLRILRVYAGPLSQQLRSALETLLPKCKIFSIYGLTEAGPSSLIASSDGRFTKLQEHNRAFDYSIWNPHRQQWAKTGESGLLALRFNSGLGPPVCLSSDRSQDRLPHPWVKTGDIAHEDLDGFIVIEGRVNDILVVGNRRRSAHEIEEKFNESSLIQCTFVFNPPNKNDEIVIVIEGKGNFSAYNDIASRSEIDCNFSIIAVSTIERTELGKIARAATLRKVLPVLDRVPSSLLQTSEARVVRFFDDRIDEATSSNVSTSSAP